MTFCSQRISIYNLEEEGVLGVGRWDDLKKKTTGLFFEYLFQNGLQNAQHFQIRIVLSFVLCFTLTFFKYLKTSQVSTSTLRLCLKVFPGEVATPITSVKRKLNKPVSVV